MVLPAHLVANTSFGHFEQIRTVHVLAANPSVNHLGRPKVKYRVQRLFPL